MSNGHAAQDKGRNRCRRGLDGHHLQPHLQHTIVCDCNGGACEGANGTYGAASSTNECSFLTLINLHCEMAALVSISSAKRVASRTGPSPPLVLNCLKSSRQHTANQINKLILGALILSLKNQTGCTDQFVMHAGGIRRELHAWSGAAFCHFAQDVAPAITCLCQGAAHDVYGDAFDL